MDLVQSETSLTNKIPLINGKYPLLAFLPEDICEYFKINEKYRGKQICKWIYSGITDFSEMSNVPLSIRNKLEEKAALRTSEITQKLTDPDGTIKLQLTLYDGQCIETVLLIDNEGRKTACVSCQVGCAMKCAFCMTGTLGFTRNLYAFEIVEQFFQLEKIAGKLDNIVFMGMGEPMLNLEEIRKAISILTDKDLRNLSSRRITISTSGIINGIYDLADNGPHVRLAVSLTTADKDLREKLMPIAKTNPLEKLKDAIKYYAEKTGKRVTLEAALMHKINTSNSSIDTMIEFVKNINVHINLIPWNKVPSLPFTEPDDNECKNFIRQLENKGINVTQRTHRGRKIGGACGQLGKTK